MAYAEFILEDGTKMLALVDDVEPPQSDDLEPVGLLDT